MHVPILNLPSASGLSTCSQLLTPIIPIPTPRYRCRCHCPATLADPARCGVVFDLFGRGKGKASRKGLQPSPPPQRPVVLDQARTTRARTAVRASKAKGREETREWSCLALFGVAAVYRPGLDGCWSLGNCHYCCRLLYRVAVVRREEVGLPCLTGFIAFSCFRVFMFWFVVLP